MLDLSTWKNEFLGQVLTQNADFDKSGKVDLTDFSLWNGVYLKK